MECFRNGSKSACGVACQGIYADVTIRQILHPIKMISLIFWFLREVNGVEDQGDREKLMLLRTEYERYKDLWGLNVRYSHSAGPTQNYSEIA